MIQFLTPEYKVNVLNSRPSTESVPHSPAARGLNVKCETFDSDCSWGDSEAPDRNRPGPPCSDLNDSDASGVVVNLRFHLSQLREADRRLGD